MEQFFENFYDFAAEHLTNVFFNIIFAVLIVFIGGKLINKVIKIIGKSMWFNKIDISVQGFLKSFMKLGLYVLLYITAAAVIGIPAASLITMLASAGVAVGLALQGALSNLAGGIIILFFKPFKVGDMIETGGCTGIVSSITVFYTILVTIDNKKVTLPNGNLTNSSITNYSAQSTRRVDLVFGVDYKSDINFVKGVIQGVVSANPLVLADPEPVVRLRAHNESSLDFAVQVWCKTEDYWTVYYDMNEDIKIAFDKNNIEIPYPHMHIVKD